MLAAGLYRGLKARRRAQWRARRPGRAVAAPGPDLAPVEKTINTTGATAAATVQFMDQALRRLAGRHAADHRPMPALAAVELNEHNLVLHLTDPVNLDHPWEGTADRMHWRCPTDVDLDDLGPETEELADQPAPYPMLVTIGSSDDGVWLLNCEELAAITITGDDTYGRDFVRYLAAELALNPWSDGIQVDCIGIAEEIAPMERDRIHFHPADQSDALRTVTGEALTDAVATIDRSQQAGVDVVTGRATQVGDDVWTARLILVDAALDQHSHQQRHENRTDGTEEANPQEAPSTGTPVGLAELLQLTVDHTGHTGTAVVTVDTSDDDGQAADTGTVLHMTSTGRVQLATAGLDLVAVGLTSDEAHGCAALLAQSEDTTDTEIPVDETAQDGWEAYTTQSGSLRPEYTRPRGSASVASAYGGPAPLGYLEDAVGATGDDATEDHLIDHPGAPIDPRGTDAADGSERRERHCGTARTGRPRGVGAFRT